jgi:hypothetical protein
MPTYRGNRGNLLQHWVLVDLLGCVAADGFEKLGFVDAYSMSPTPTRSSKAATDQTAHEFDRVRSWLAKGNSAYEHAWLALGSALPSEYPSSAAFVRHCWPRSVHFLLCEADEATADDIQRWLSGLDDRTTSLELYRGDWRERLAKPFPADCDVYYLSFDPNMYDRHDVRLPKPENMYSSDIDTIGDAIRRLPAAPIVVQLSTYSVNGANSQSDVFESLVPRFTAMDFTATPVRADNSMMSFIFSRGITVASDLENRFRSWLTDRRGAV